jgi:hypothetical protein
MKNKFITDQVVDDSFVVDDSSLTQLWGKSANGFIDMRLDMRQATPEESEKYKIFENEFSPVGQAELILLAKELRDKHE